MKQTFPSVMICPDCGKRLVIETSDTNKPFHCTECNKRFSIANAKLMTFEFWYSDCCPKAHIIEDIVNRSSNDKEKAEKCLAEMPWKDLISFIFLCLLYWSKTEHYDDRNRYAILASRRIVERFPNIGVCTGDDEELYKEAFGFTQCAHRYLQNEFFKLAFQIIKSEGIFGLADWFEHQEFVYANDYKSLIPRAEWHPYSI